jgi:ABC-type Mn2+/Zn2+ transport system ATPase subunit
MTASTDRRSDATVALRDVKVVRGDDTALDVESLDLRPGVTALIGPNGSGKSTLLHAVAGLLPLATGSIERREGSIAYVLQTPPSAAHLLVTAREVVALARAAERGAFGRMRAADRDLVERSMERLEITDLARRHLAELSGGQRQRVFVAQGLAQDAPVLLLDEPTAGLDLASSQAITRIVEGERAAGRTVVIATHDLDEAATADHVVLLNSVVIASGTPSDVLTGANVRRAYGGRVLELGEGIVAIDDGVHHHHHEHDHHAGRSGTDEHRRHAEHPER